MHAVGSFVVPFYPPNPKQNPNELMKANPGRFDYQLYFQQPGVAEAEFSKNIQYTFKCLLRSARKEDRVTFTQPVSTTNV
jgi:soluble epoxide hydrolase/lipid-phosphate phosphatase